MSTPARYHLHKFHGGLRLDTHKSESTQQAIQSLPLPKTLTLPLSQHTGNPCEPLVTVGDHVLKGQRIADSPLLASAPIHAPTSGTVIEIGDKPVAHPSGLPGRCIVIESDGEDQWTSSYNQPTDDISTLDTDSLSKHIREAGIVGLGGAVFPTALKLNSRPDTHLHTLVINGVECEPYITCDDMLICERPADIIGGVEMLCDALQIKVCLIAIEDDMPMAYEAISSALAGTSRDNIRIVQVPARYPAGGERQLIKILLNQEVPYNGYPIDIGVLCLNVATVASIYHALMHARPLISRIVTVTGPGINNPANVEALFGTSVQTLVEACGGYSEDIDELILGGPMMGFALHSDNVPVTKATNCLLASTAKAMPPNPPAMPCIRCMDCVRVCPVNLMPQELYWYASNGDFARARDYHLYDCIECGCCSYVCPSHIPLVHYYRHAKDRLREHERDRQAAEHARERYESRIQRIELEQARKQDRMKKKNTDRVSTDAKQSLIKKALEQAKTKKQTSQ